MITAKNLHKNSLITKLCSFVILLAVSFCFISISTARAEEATEKSFKQKAKEKAIDYGKAAAGGLVKSGYNLATERSGKIVDAAVQTGEGIKQTKDGIQQISDGEYLDGTLKTAEGLGNTGAGTLKAGKEALGTAADAIAPVTTLFLSDVSAPVLEQADKAYNAYKSVSNPNNLKKGQCLDAEVRKDATSGKEIRVLKVRRMSGTLEYYEEFCNYKQYGQAVKDNLDPTADADCYYISSMQNPNVISSYDSGIIRCNDNGQICDDMANVVTASIYDPEKDEYVNKTETYIDEYMIRQKYTKANENNGLQNKLNSDCIVSNQLHGTKDAKGNKIPQEKQASKARYIWEAYNKWINDGRREDQLIGETFNAEAPGGVEIKEIEIPGKDTNAACRIQDVSKRYLAKCYSCTIIKTLIGTFMQACASAEDITKQAGVKIIQLGFMIWIAFFVMKNVSSLTNVEPSSMINTLLIMMFKCLVALTFITIGVEAFLEYIVAPIMFFGADYGMALMGSLPTNMNVATSPEYIYSQSAILPADIINRIIGFTQKLEQTVATNFIIGHALTCHSVHAGAWVIEIVGNIKIKVPNAWIWAVGAAIWVFAFMMTLGVSYYLLDISFKLGFSIIAFPIVAALWPFNLTKDKLKKVVSIIIKSAAIFAMLAMTTSYAITLIGESLRDLTVFYQKVDAGDSEWISETFAITGSYFVIIVFAYLFSFKLVGSTLPGYVDKLFPDGVFKGMSPMHNKMTQLTDFAKKKALGLGKFGLGAAAGVAGGAMGMMRGGGSGESGGEGGGGADGGKGKHPMIQAGRAMKFTGQTMDASGKMTKEIGRAHV